MPDRKFSIPWVSVTPPKILAFSLDMTYTETEDGSYEKWVETLSYKPGSGDEWFVFDADGNRLGLSCKVHGQMYYMPLAEPPIGATSAAWVGPWPSSETS